MMFLCLSINPSGLEVRKVVPPGWKPRLYGRQDARRYALAPRETVYKSGRELVLFRPKCQSTA